jgi:hypothetical protein
MNGTTGNGPSMLGNGPLNNNGNINGNANGGGFQPSNQMKLGVGNSSSNGVPGVLNVPAGVNSSDWSSLNSNIFNSNNNNNRV